MFHPQLDFTLFGALQYQLPENFFDQIAVNADNVDAIYAVIDQHPPTQISFAANHLWRYPGQSFQHQGIEMTLYPIHAVQGTFGATIVKRLTKIAWTSIISKHNDPDEYGFSKQWELQLQGLVQTLPPDIVYQICGIEHEGIIYDTVAWLENKSYKVELLPQIYYPEINVVFPPNLSME